MASGTMYNVLALSLMVFILVYKFIPLVSSIFLEKNIVGVDLNKPSKIKVPESVGIVPVVIYLLCILCLCALFKDSGYIYHFYGLLYYSSVTAMIGLYDDMFGLRWRYKISFPSLALIPILYIYNKFEGNTMIELPNFLRYSIGLSVIDLGYFYYLYLVLVTVFCTNSINIYAGINGLEAGQTVLISLSLMALNSFYLNINDFSGVFKSGHFFSYVCLLPFFFSVFAIYQYNKYPSKVFVGDVFTLFAGSTIAVISIFGGYSHYVLLFFIPQLVNFLYSLPQLFNPMNCPAHRVPNYNNKTGKLQSSLNLTLINLVLEIFGEKTESELNRFLMYIQITSSFAAFAILKIFGVL